MENLSKKPIKGILKSSSSFEQSEANQREAAQTDKDIKWDEMNILQTLHPPDKDYGHMKIEEPKTPFNYYAEETDGGDHLLDPQALASKLTETADELPKSMIHDEEKVEDDDDDDNDEDLTEEERQKRKEFESKRKSHYNEFYAVKLARKLLEEDNDDDDDDEKIHDENGDRENNKNDNQQESVDPENCNVDNQIDQNVNEPQNR